MAEYTLSYTASEINSKLGKIDSLVQTVNGTAPDSTGNVTISITGGGVGQNVADKEFQATQEDGSVETVVAQAYAEVFNRTDLNIATGYGAHAEGGVTEANGDYSHAEGNLTKALGDGSHAEGNETTASGINSHAEGDYTVASGNGAHAEGNQTIASGSKSHAEGVFCEATAFCAHAEGSSSKATAYCSHAEGDTSLAAGSASHAEGKRTQANGDASHAEGKGTIATGTQHVEGLYNIALSGYLHIAGNGTADDARSNAYTLDTDGNGWFAGSVSVNSVIMRSSTEGSTKQFRLTVDDSGTLTVTEIV